MTRTRGYEHSAREDYADALIDVQSRCRADGLSFFAEMTTLAAAWLHARRAAGGDADFAVDVPEPDSGEISPARILFDVARNTPTGRLKPAAEPRPTPPPFLPVNCRCELPPAADPPPPPPAPARSPASFRARPETRELHARMEQLLRDGGGPISLPPKWTLAALRVRCSTISAADPRHRLKATRRPDGSFEIQRCNR